MDVRLRKRQMNDHICNYSSSGKCHCLAYASKHGIGLLVPEGSPCLYFACLFGGEGDESPSQIFFLSIPAIPYSNGQHQHFRDTNWKHWRQTSVAFWKVIISNSNDFSQKKKKQNNCMAMNITCTQGSYIIPLWISLETVNKSIFCFSLSSPHIFMETAKDLISLYSRSALSVIMCKSDRVHR